MGCGISKIDPEEAGARPASAFKHHHRRHGHANVYNPVVVSESVIENGIKEDDSVTRYSRKSMSSSPAAPHGSGSGSGVVAEYDVQQMNAKKADHSDEKLHWRGLGRDDNDLVDGHNGGGGESSNDEDDHNFIPGSPSFREYCIDSCSIRDNNEGIIYSKEDNNSQKRRSLSCEIPTRATEERSLSYKKVHGSKSPETQRKNARKGFKRPGWIGRHKKSI